MKTEKLMLFAYDFPHKKTQEFIVRLYVEGYKIAYVIAAPWKKLHIPQPGVRIEPRYSGLIHPRKLCEKFKIPYIVLDHNSSRTHRYLRTNPVDLCIISGARILSGPTIKATQHRILNVHPGLLPQVRGLDTLLWSIFNDIPIGLSAHFIDTKIDAGLLIHKKTLPLYADDTLIDISLRIIESQSQLLLDALKILKSRQMKDLLNLDLTLANYHSKMLPRQEKKAITMFNIWLKKYVDKQNHEINTF